jgi:heme A synthase
MNQVPLDQLPLPVGAGVASLIGVLACLGACAVAVAGGRFGRWTRSVAVVTLIAVMIQGLLGGFRVFLDQLFGTQLAAYHGVFAQVVLSLMCAVVVLAAPRRMGDSLPAEDRARVGWLAMLLPMAVFVQLVWAVWVRHVGSPVAQRLHILTAFVVVALAVWLTVRILATPAGRKQLGFLVYHLLAIIGLQVLLGVEAYMAKFAASGPNARVLPMDRIATPHDAGIRTAHAVVGAALLAAAVVLALRANRRPLTVPAQTEPANRANPIGEPVAVS